MFNRIKTNDVLLRSVLRQVKKSGASTVAVWYHYPDRPIDEANCYVVDYSYAAFVAACLYNPTMDEVGSVPSAESALLDFVSRPSRLSMFALSAYFILDEVLVYDACANVQYALKRNDLACC